MKKHVIHFLVLAVSILFSLNDLQARQRYAQDEILVKFKPETAESRIGVVIRNLGALQFKHSFRKRFCVVKVPEGMVETMQKRFSQNPAVERVTLNYVFDLYTVPNDPYYSEQWNLQMMESVLGLAFLTTNARCRAR